ncbi:MAG: TolC family protein [Desulfotomaculaceae bacterium]|nr:TolC family protein [Desulfotomaculaceae bacterium]
MRRIAMLVVLCIALNCIIAADCALARELETPELTFQQAVESAKSNSNTLKNADYDIDRSKELRDTAADNVLYTPLEPSTTAAERAFTGLQQSDLNWRMVKRAYAAEEDRVVMQVYQSYNGLLQAIENVKLAEVQLKNEEWQRTVASASYRVGMLNKMGLVQAEAAVATAKSILEANRKALDDAYQKFNLLVGLWPEYRPVLVDNPRYKELEVNDLDYEVKKALEESPTVWLAQKKVDLAKSVLSIYNYADLSIEPYQVKEIDLDKAEVSAEDANEQFRKLVRTLYYSVKQLEQQYLIAQESVKVAEEALRVIKVKYEVGMATMPEVLAAETAFEKAKKQQFDILCQHEVLTYAFQKPWAYAGA